MGNSSDWIHARLKNFEGRLAEKKMKQEWRANASAAYNSMFDRLKKAVTDDVDIYNHAFANHRECRAKFILTNDGFRVETGSGGVGVEKRTGSTAIALQYDRPGRTDGGFDHLEVTPDDKGRIGYMHKEHFCLHESEVSERILDGILCG